jgi:hypothetical protein
MQLIGWQFTRHSLTKRVAAFEELPVASQSASMLLECPPQLVVAVPAGEEGHTLSPWEPNRPAQRYRTRAAFPHPPSPASCFPGPGCSPSERWGNFLPNKPGLALACKGATPLRCKTRSVARRDKVLVLLETAMLILPTRVGLVGAGRVFAALVRLALTSVNSPCSMRTRSRAIGS